MNSEKAPEEKKPDFSMVIPVYNHAETVGDVVRAALQLGFPVILVDDGSTDHSAERVRQIEAKALRKLRHPSRSRSLREIRNLQAV